MTSPSHSALLTVIVAMAVVALSFPAAGQEKYPASPIRLVVGSPAGGSSTDTFARLLAEKLATPLGVLYLAAHASHVVDWPVPEG